jgi:hypothetical protein
VLARWFFGSWSIANTFINGGLDEIDIRALHEARADTSHLANI